jgi:hypothetical protein
MKLSLKLLVPMALLVIGVVAWRPWVPPPDDSGYACPWRDAAQSQWIAGKAQTRELVVMLHAFTRSPEGLCQVGEWLRSHDPAGPDLLVPKLPLDVFSVETMDQIAMDVAAQVQARWDARAKAPEGGYERVRFLGHSMGSLVARRVYLDGLATNPPAPWARKTDRIVLLAGVNRGWTIDHHMSLLNSLVYQLGEDLNGWTTLFGRPPFTVMHARHGAPFVNELRLRWQELPSLADRQAPGFQVVQLLGTVDDIVPPGDNVDAASAAGLTYLQMPSSGHTNVVRLLADAEQPAAAAARAAVFQRAWNEENPVSDAVPLAVRRARPDPCVRHVVFVMHGIRDEGHWTERVAAAVEDALEPTLPPRSPECQARGDARIAFEISSYGYFPMLSFLRPSARQEKAAWLMDRYAEARALYPNAAFHYVGHSHGTYLLREALRQVPGVRFDRVVLAGSVLRVGEHWQPFFDRGQVGQLLNLRASGDWVVAIFPNTMERIGWQDLGGAGFEGFKDGPPGLTNGPLRDSRLAYVQGAHGAAVDEPAWHTIAHFVAQGELDQAGLHVVPDPEGWVDWAARWGLLLWAVLLGLIGLGLWCLWRWRVREGVKVLAMLAYLNIIWLVITRV